MNAVPSSLSGAEAAQMLQGAAGWVALHREPLNQINVYPVPDGDTGSNLARTLVSAAAAAEEALAEGQAGWEVASAAASAALLGGRGSSGVIAAQWLRGLADGLQAGGMVEALASAADAARRAVAEPRDGTMISAAADTAAAVADADGSTLAILQQAAEACREAVERTPQQNPVLLDAGVVDSGARGLEFILRGMAGALAGDDIPAAPAELGAIDPNWLAKRLDEGGDEDGFCTELVVADVADLDALQAELSGADESVMLAPDGADLRIHLHTTEPADAYAAAEAAGRIRAFRAVDMRGQAARTHEADLDPAVIAVAQGAGFVRVFTELGAAAIVSGGPADNPSVEMLLSAAESVKGAEVLVLPNDHNVAPAAARAGELAAAQTPAQTFHVVQTDSQAEGAAALAALIGGVPAEDAAAELAEALEHVQVGRVALAARDYGGRTPVRQGEPFQMLDGEIVGAGSSIDEALLELGSQMAASLAGASLFTLFFGADIEEERAEELAELLAETAQLEVDLIAGGQPHYPYLLTLE